MVVIKKNALGIITGRIVGWFILLMTIGIILIAVELIIAGVIAILLIALPIFIKMVSFSCLKYTYDDETLYVDKGVINKQHLIIPLYRVVDIHVNANILGVGTFKVQEKSKTIFLKCVDSPRSQRENLMKAWKNARKDEKITTHEVF